MKPKNCSNPFKRWHFFCIFLGICAACNPFAPELEAGDPFGDLGNAKTVEGFFTQFKNAYDLRDIALYQPLLDSNFVFVYRDFDTATERQWGFVQDLESTRNLFQNAQSIRLDWNQVIRQEVALDKRRAQIIRPFNLTITLSGNEVFRGSGNVNFQLTRADSTQVWKLLVWRDESEFKRKAGIVTKPFVPLKD